LIPAREKQLGLGVCSLKKAESVIPYKEQVLRGKGAVAVSFTPGCRPGLGQE